MNLLRRKRRTVILLLLTPVALYLLFRLFEHVQVYQPRSELVTDPGGIGLEFESVRFPSGNGPLLHGWFLPAPEDSAWRSWAVVVSHGNGGNISHRLDLYRIWHEEGFPVLAYDYRGYGRSGGFPTPGGTFTDAESAHGWLVERNFAPERILALGESLGGGVAVELARRREIGGLVLQSTFTGLQDLASELFPWLPVRTLGTIRYPVRDHLPSLEVPVLLLHGRQDTIIPFSHALRNREAIRSPAHLEELEGDHNDPLPVDRYREGIRSFKRLLIERDGARERI